MNSVNIIGNLTRDPEVKHTNGGNVIVKLGLAWNGRKKDSSGNWVDEPHFFDVTCFGERYEKLAEYLEKGKKIGVSGRLDFQSWEQDGQKRSKVGIVAFDITFASNAGDQSSTPRPADDDVPASAFTPVGGSTADDDDIPF